MSAPAGPFQSTKPSRLPLFWRLQLIGWGGLALLTLPAKKMLYGSLASSLIITAYQLPLALLLTALLRWFYEWTAPARRPYWQTSLLVLIGCATASSVDVLAGLTLNQHLGLHAPAEIMDFGLYAFRTALYVIWSLAYFLAQALFHSREQAFQAAIAEEKHRFELLRYQLNPAFLAKSLATISRAIGESPLHARMMTTRLSDYYQNTVRPSAQGQPPTIGDEIALLRTYLEIERLHLHEALEVRYDVDPSLMGQPLPPVLLLPLAEQAIKTGGGTPERPLVISITVQRTADGLILLEVANSGRLNTTHHPFEESTSQTLADFQASLERHYPGRHRFALTQDSFMARATVCLPLAG